MNMFKRFLLKYWYIPHFIQFEIEDNAISLYRDDNPDMPLEYEDLD